jgi:hypothetical protein
VNLGLFPSIAEVSNTPAQPEEGPDNQEHNKPLHGALIIAWIFASLLRGLPFISSKNVALAFALAASSGVTSP